MFFGMLRSGGGNRARGPPGPRAASRRSGRSAWRSPRLSNEKSVFLLGVACGRRYFVCWRGGGTALRGSHRQRSVIVVTYFPKVLQCKRPLSNLVPDTLRASPVMEISELAQLVANHMLLNSPNSLVSVARTCRGPKKQTLGTSSCGQNNPSRRLSSEAPYHWALYPPSSYHPQVCNTDCNLARSDGCVHSTKIECVLDALARL